MAIESQNTCDPNYLIIQLLICSAYSFTGILFYTRKEDVTRDYGIPISLLLLTKTLMLDPLCRGGRNNKMFEAHYSGSGIWGDRIINFSEARN